MQSWFLISLLISVCAIGIDCTSQYGTLKLLYKDVTCNDSATLWDLRDGVVGESSTRNVYYSDAGHVLGRNLTVYLCNNKMA